MLPRRARTIPLRSLGLLLVTGCMGSAQEPPASVQQPQSHTLTSNLVSIYNLAGRTEIVSHTGPNVVVEVRALGPDAGELRVAVDPIEGRESLRVLYPETEIRYADPVVTGERGRSRVELQILEDGTFGRGIDGGGFLGFGRREVEITMDRGSLEAWADLRILVPAGTDVELHVGLGAISVQDVTGTLSLDTRGGAVSAARTAGSLDVSTGAGSIVVEVAEGMIDLDTGSGRVSVNQVIGSTLSIDTGSGSVEGNAVTVDALDIDTGSGSVRLASINSGDVQVDTGSGSVTLGLNEDVGQLDVETGSGRVDLFVPASLGAEVSVRTGSGRIETEIPLRLTTARRNRLEGSFGDGLGQIDIDTGSGGVAIRAN